MIAFPKDILTEPAHVDPTTLDNLGPLRRLAGTWQAQKGVDVNPKAAGTLFKIEEPQPNPLARLVAARAANT